MEGQIEFRTLLRKLSSDETASFLSLAEEKQEENIIWLDDLYRFAIPPQATALPSALL